MGLLLLLSTPTSAAPSGGDSAEFAFHLVFFGDIRFEAISLNVQQIITEVL